MSSTPMIGRSAIEARISSPLPLRCRELVYRRGWAKVAMSVRLFLIAIAVLAVGAIAFLIVTA